MKIIRRRISIPPLKGEKMDGIIIINKEKKCTSHDVVYEVKKIFKEKVGHTGTLDPNATGVLPILIGKGTGLSNYLINHEKKYIATLKLGIKTETADVEGKVVEEKNVNLLSLNKENISGLFKELCGKHTQKPPMYSAIKVNGKKLYEYARSGKNVDIPKREIEIYDMELQKIDIDIKTITFEIHCSKGTYVRSVCETIAERLGTVGYLLELKRTMVGEFCIEKSVTVNDVRNNVNNLEFIEKNLISIEKFFKNKYKVILNEKKLKLFLNGVVLNLNSNDVVKIENDNMEFANLKKDNTKPTNFEEYNKKYIDYEKEDVVRIYDEKNNFIGTATTFFGKFKRDIIVG